jgi:hypothetical protein
MNRLRSFSGALLVCGAVLAGVVGLAPAVASARVAHMVAFSSPSRNIGCILFRAEGYWIARCDIGHRDWSPPKRPKRCHLDYGQGVYVSGRGRRGGYVCAGDTALGAKRVLAYGHKLRRGTILCTSMTTGMRCVNVRDGHGFLISRETVKLY